MAEDSMEELTRMQISSFDDDDDDEISDDDVDADEEGDDENEPVTLGFVEKPQTRWSLLRQVFPSKAGGTPAWLDPINLPLGRSCICDICGEPLQFLLQVYAPISEKESTFHRTLYVFICTSMKCLLRDQHEQWKRGPGKLSRSVKVYRCQLPCINPFYLREPPNYDGTDTPLKNGAPLCTWCGAWKGDKVCGSCRNARYCSEKHQAAHWSSSHKLECRKMNLSSPSLSVSPHNGTVSEDTLRAVSKTLWPEYEIIHEEECESDTASVDEEQDKSLVCRKQNVDTVKSCVDNLEGDDDKKCWARFQERLSKAPEQVLRYCRNIEAKPLWPSSSGRPSKADLPKCSYCDAALVYEIQILPQLLYYLGVKNDEDSLDWASIVVYTCVDSCEAGPVYREEFAWVQLSSQSASLP